MANCRLCHGRQGRPRPPRPRGLAWRLAQALGIARHGRVAPRIPPGLALSEEAHGVTGPRVPVCQERRVRGGEETAAAIDSALTRGQGLHPEVAKHRSLAHPPRLGHGPRRPPLLVEGPDLLMERPPRRLALVRQRLGWARGGGGWHRPGARAVRLRHGRRAEGLIDGREEMAVGVTPLVEGCGQVLPQVKAVGHLDRVWGTLRGPVRIGSGALAGDHAHTGRALEPEGEGLGLPIRQEGQRAPPFTVEQHGAIGLACLVGPVVDAEYLGCGTPEGADDAAAAAGWGDG